MQLEMRFQILISDDGWWVLGGRDDRETSSTYPTEVLLPLSLRVEVWKVRSS